MDAVQLKQSFNNTKSLQAEMKVEYERFEKIAEEMVRFPHMTQMHLEKIEQTRAHFEDQLKEYNEDLVNMYQYAIVGGIDVDNTRLLKAFQFFYNKGDHITHLLRCINLPRGATSIWIIVLYTACIYLWAIM